MPALPLLLADWGQLIVLAIVFILWAGGQFVKLLTKAMKPPQVPGGNVGNPRPPVARPQAVDDEIEEFLRRAAQNRPGQPPRPQPAVPQAAAQQRPQQMAQRPPQPQRPPQQPQRPQQQPQRAQQQSPRPQQQPQRGAAGQPQSRPMPQQRPSVVQSVEVVEERPFGSLAQHVSQSMERRTLDDDPNTQSRVEFADDLMQKHIHQAFDHKLGQLGGSTSGQPSGPAAGSLPAGIAPASGATALAALLANPGSMRTAIILHEILQPRDFDRDFPQIPAERP